MQKINKHLLKFNKFFTIHDIRYKPLSQFVLLLGMFFLFCVARQIIVYFHWLPLSIISMVPWIMVLVAPFVSPFVYIPYYLATSTFTVFRIYRSSGWEAGLNGITSTVISGIFLIAISHSIHHIYLRMKKLNLRLEDSRKKESQARRRAEAAVKSRGLFLANMSHEIRTPISGIMGVSEILKNYIHDPDGLEYLNMIKESSESLLYIVNDILDYSKIESGHLSLSTEEFNLPQLIKQRESYFAKKAEAKGLVFISGDTSLLPKMVIGDKTRLMQVFNNILSNAVKYTIKGQIKLSNEILNTEGGVITLCFKIEDTGIGIPKEESGKLFQAFSQLDNSYSKNVEGTGLGLALTKNILQFMGGDITVESNLGEGSCFSFTLSLKESKKDPIESSIKEEVVDSRPGSQKSLSILVAEDSKINQVFLRYLLSKSNHIIKLVENGKDAVDAYLKGDFQMIIMDLQLPGMSGFQAIQKIREWEIDQKLKRVPICVLTAYAMTQDKEKVLKAGGDFFLSKPVDAEKLNDIVCQVGNQHYSLS